MGVGEGRQRNDRGRKFASFQQKIGRERDEDERQKGRASTHSFNNYEFCQLLIAEV